MGALRVPPRTSRSTTHPCSIAIHCVAHALRILGAMELRYLTRDCICMMCSGFYSSLSFLIWRCAHSFLRLAFRAQQAAVAVA